MQQTTPNQLGKDAMLVEQAVYTSVRTGRNEGYQLAVKSPGISDQQARELTQWGPGHDSVYSGLPGAKSINFHRMESGPYCVSQTALAGREYSGRGGPRVYTHIFLVPTDILPRFGNTPFRVMDALVASGRFTIAEQVPLKLQPIRLVGRASLVNTANLEHVNRKTGPHKLATLVNAALRTKPLGVISRIPGRNLFNALLDLLPLAVRPHFSLTTGLRVSAARHYRLAILPNVAEEQRQAIRQVHLDPVNLINDPPAKYAPNSGWAELMYHLLKAEQFNTIAKIMELTAHGSEADTDLLAEQQRERLEKDAENTAFTPFPT